MKTILQRFLELSASEELQVKSRFLMAELAFKPVTDTMTGEEFALALATICAYGQTLLAPTDASVKVTEQAGGKVYAASLRDSVRTQDVLGG